MIVSRHAVIVQYRHSGAARQGRTRNPGGIADMRSGFRAPLRGPGMTCLGSLMTGSTKAEVEQGPQRGCGGVTLTPPPHTLVTGMRSHAFRDALANDRGIFLGAKLACSGLDSGNHAYNDHGAHHNGPRIPLWTR